MTLSLDDQQKILSILVKKEEKIVSSKELYQITLIEEIEIINFMNNILIKIPFIKTNNKKSTLNYEYILSFPDSIKIFIKNFIEYTKSIINKNPYNRTYSDIDNLLKLNAIDLNKIVFYFQKDNPKKLGKSTIKNYLSYLKFLNYLLVNDGNYYLNSRYVDILTELEEIIELEKFWNLIDNYQRLVNINFHDLQFSIRNIRISYDDLLDIDGWELKNSNNGQKTYNYDTLFGKVKFIVYHSKTDYHSMRITFRGKIIEQNDKNHKVSNKKYISSKQLENFIGVIQNKLYEFKQKHLFHFEPSKFNEFNIDTIGINIDYEEEDFKTKIINSRSQSYPSFRFDKEVTYRDFMDRYISRYYTYKDKILNKDMIRLEHHTLKNPTKATVNSLCEDLSYRGKYLNNSSQIKEVSDKQDCMIGNLDELKKNDKRHTDFMVDIKRQDQQNHMIIDGKINLMSNQFQDRMIKLEDKVRLSKENMEFIYTEDYKEIKENISNNMNNITTELININQSSKNNLDSSKNFLEYTENLNQYVSNSDLERKENLEEKKILVDNLINLTSIVKKINEEKKDSDIKIYNILDKITDMQKQNQDLIQKLIEKKSTRKKIVRQESKQNIKPKITFKDKIKKLFKK